MRHNLPLVGRNAELTFFSDTLRRRSGGVLLLAGEAGIGKTRLTHAWLDHAKEADYATVVGRCSGPGQVIPVDPWREALLAAETPADIAALAYQMAAELSGSPTILVLEDVHWADSRSLELLHHLSPLLGSGRSQLVLSYRTEALRRGHPLYGLLPALHRAGAVTVHLEPLGESDLEQLARAAGRAEMSAELFARSGGLPFFACELLQSTDKRIPRLVGQAMDERLHDLDVISLELLRIAAVLGDEFTYEQLQQLAMGAEESLLHVLEEAIAHAILIETPQGFRFRHRLVREALYDELIGPRRARLHRSAADIVLDLDRRANHLALAGTPEAVPVLVAAGSRALGAGEYAKAYHHFKQALQLEPGSPGGELLLLAGAAARHVDEERAADLISQAKQASPDPAVTALAHHQLAWLACETGDPRAPRLMDGAHKLLADLWREPRLAQLQELIHGRRPPTPGTVDGLAAVYLASGRPEAARDLLQEAVGEIGPVRGEYDHAILAEIALLGCDLDSAFALWEASVGDALLRNNYPAALQRLALWLEHLVLDRGTERAEIDRVGAWLQELLPKARLSGIPGMGARGPMQALWYMAGDWESIRSAPVGLSRPWQAYADRWLLRADLAEERYDQAADRLCAALQLGRQPRLGEYRHTMSAMTTLALLALRAGDLRTAGQWLKSVDNWHEGPRPSLYNHLQNLLGWAEYWRLAGEPKRALRSALEARGIGAGWRLTTSALLPASLHLYRLDADHSEEHRQTAANLAKSAGQPHLLASIPKPTAAPPGRWTHGLTAREAEIATLVAQGLTDKEIAARLVISPRTVDGHLRNAFAKLGLTSRAGLAVWATRHGLLADDGSHE